MPSCCIMLLLHTRWDRWQVGEYWIKYSFWKHQNKVIYGGISPQIHCIMSKAEAGSHSPAIICATPTIFNLHTMHTKVINLIGTLSPSPIIHSLCQCCSVCYPQNAPVIHQLTSYPRPVTKNKGSNGVEIVPPANYPLNCTSCQLGNDSLFLHCCWI